MSDMNFDFGIKCQCQDSSQSGSQAMAANWLAFDIDILFRRLVAFIETVKFY